MERSWRYLLTFSIFILKFLELETIFHMLEFAISVRTLDQPSQFI